VVRAGGHLVLPDVLDERPTSRPRPASSSFKPTGASRRPTANPRLASGRDARLCAALPGRQGSEILADRWTLLIVREMLGGASGFNELQRGLPRIARGGAGWRDRPPHHREVGGGEFDVERDERLVEPVAEARAGSWHDAATARERPRDRGPGDGMPRPAAAARTSTSTFAGARQAVCRKPGSVMRPVKRHPRLSASARGQASEPLRYGSRKGRAPRVSVAANAWLSLRPVDASLTRRSDRAPRRPSEGAAPGCPRL
jgi:hypothetical protein